ncbi:arylsulfatase [Sandaracinobacter sp. RS1-74]|uniref:arylsulfatase n=1 Tax=Sandaracinobacteroides sayramensis TaxID=2913411 RepID=UPI001EDBE4FE|nr:arylsulfatase [Sandaracinobacteroides sayramensis]MCG2840267.1 arylsulfatase [Sandaracinobacteroides sayramensis]
MRKFAIAATVGFTLGFAAVPAFAGQPAPAPKARPDFLVIIADDLGYTDIGAFGGEIPTPNLDRLASEGERFTDYHVNATCSPTRASFLTGLDHHEAGLGTMAELIAPNQQGKPGHEGYLRRDVATIAERLGEAGYATLLSGKWHLGLTPEQDPHARGFQQSFALLQGGHNHFGLGASQDINVFNASYRENGRTVDSLPANFFSSDTFADKLIGQLGKVPRSKPLFAVLTFTAPHWPLQARPEDIARFKGRYEAGYEALRSERLARQKQLGLLSPATVPHEIQGQKWAELSPEEQAKQARLMEIYAAMVHNLDGNVGRVVAELKRQGRYDNTVILFFSDNGAEGLNVSDLKLGPLSDRLAKVDNSLANLGAASSYESYGPGWAQAATSPSWLYKAFQTEGGTRSPLILKAPGFTKGGGVARWNAHVTDVAPTILDLAGVTEKREVAGHAVKPISGKSWKAVLTGKAEAVRGPEEVIGGELFGSRKLRQGDWKITDIGDGKWRLFNLAQDPGETRDLAAEQPARFQALKDAWGKWAAEVGVILADRLLPRKELATTPGGNSK